MDAASVAVSMLAAADAATAVRSVIANGVVLLCLVCEGVAAASDEKAETGVLVRRMTW